MEKKSMATVVDKPASSHTSEAVKVQAGFLLVDLGKHGRKQIKRLRKGEGKLVDEVQRCMHELRSAGTLSDSSSPVVILVREKRPRLTWF
jgi:hypothetical protein